MKVLVRSAISEFELDALPKTQAREIFHLMCKNLLIFERWYFGIVYVLNGAEEVWIDESKKTLKDIRTVVQHLQFRVKYYPEDVAEELIETSTIELFFSQVKKDIYKNKVYCPADTCALLASYALQARFGDYEPSSNGERSIEKQRLIPDRVLNQHKLDISEWEESIKSLWKRHRGLDSQDSMLEYLKLAQNLEMYGVSYFDIRNKKGSDLILGVNALGLDIYKPEDKLNPQISFPWSEIKNLKFKDRKFIIKPVDKTSQDFVFFTNSPRISKHILNLGIGNHALYVKRRKPESPEITKMKERAKSLRKLREEDKLKLNKERAAREEVEQRESEYKSLIKKMNEEMERNRTSLLEAQNTIQKLHQQLQELRQSKEELEKQQEELRDMMARLEESKNLEISEKQALEEEIRAKQLEVLRIQEEVAAKDRETTRLKEEVEEAKRREEAVRREEEERRQREIEETARREAEAAELEAVPVGANVTLPEVSKVDENLQEQLRLLQERLNESKNQEMETQLDKIHKVNLREGRNKYKTLADIRRGNTVRRVEMFENL